MNILYWTWLCDDYWFMMVGFVDNEMEKRDVEYKLYFEMEILFALMNEWHDVWNI